MVWNNTNIGSAIAPKVCSISQLTAAGAGDATPVNGASIDRLLYDSAAVVVCSRANIAATKNLVVALKLQHSADGSTWADAPADNQPGGVAGGGPIATITDTGDTTSLAQYDVNLRGLKQYVRTVVTPDLSNTATDTATVAVMCVLGGPSSMPVT